ncbi:hypothetical protein JW835_12070 [bacterium]|nr:hypothetical protein [bacterium]
MVHNTYANQKSEDLVFEFVPRQEPKRIIETNESSAEIPKRADFLSDKQSIAQNPDNTPRMRNNMPYAEGQVTLGSIQPPPQSAQKPEAFQIGDKQPDSVTPEGLHVRKNASSAKPEFNRERLLGIQRPAQVRIPEPTYKELQASVEKSGGISFNTYDWEWAPYMLKIKEIIQKNIFPPASFTRLGFGGSHLIRFRIARSGDLTGPSVLGLEGDKVLTETSSNAIILSAPFPPLPEDFPKQYLEVTVLFRYFGKESF